MATKKCSWKKQNLYGGRTRFISKDGTVLSLDTTAPDRRYNIPSRNIIIANKNISNGKPVKYFKTKSSAERFARAYMKKSC